MKSKSLHNEILVTAIKLVHDCKSQIKTMNTNPLISNIVANLSQLEHDFNVTTVKSVYKPLFFSKFKSKVGGATSPRKHLNLQFSNG